MKNPFKPKHIGAGYLLRWHLIPRNRFFNIYLHKFVGNDDERALHDHPWWSFSIKLCGRMMEYFKPSDLDMFCNRFYGIDMTRRRFVKRFTVRSPEFAHRLELVGNKPAWTIFITGPVNREWGFHCPKGWQHWSTMTTKDGKTIGGCE